MIDRRGKMAMTVEEAKEKICPYAMTACFMGAGDALCEADTCMAWRWNDTEIKDGGYCGLAGKEGRSDV